MPEQLAEVAGRFVWGDPNTDEHGRLIRRHCTHRALVGWMRWERAYGEGCAINQSGALLE